MARHALIDDEELLGRLCNVFRRVGYEGASLALLSEASGLKKASLYHRFPDGKAQMAAEVLNYCGVWLGDNILGPLDDDTAAPEARMKLLVKRLDEFYEGGNKACILNLLSSPDIDGGMFTETVRGALEALIAALAKVGRDAGHSRAEAQTRASRAVAMLQGSLVLSRGMNSTKPFRDFLKNLPGDILS